MTRRFRNCRCPEAHAARLKTIREWRMPNVTAHCALPLLLGSGPPGRVEQKKPKYASSNPSSRVGRHVVVTSRELLRHSQLLRSFALLVALQDDKTNHFRNMGVFKMNPLP